MAPTESTIADGPWRLQTLAAVALLVWLCVAIVPAHPRPTGPAHDAALLLAGPLLLAIALFRGGRRPPRALVVGSALLGLLIVLHVLSAPATERAAVARDAGLLASLILVALAASASAPARLEYTLAEITPPLMLGLALLGLTQAWTGWNGLPQSHPPAATFVNRNVAAWSLIALLPFCAMAMRHTARPRLRSAAALSFGLGLALLIATRSRGAWLGAALGWTPALIAFLVANRQRWRERRPSIVNAVLIGAPCLAACLVPTSPASAVPPLGERVSSLARPLEGTGAVRLAIWKNTLAMIGEAPLLGVGHGRFAVEYPQYQQAVVPTPFFGLERQPEHAENDPLEIGAELGVIGVALIAAFFLGAIGIALRAGRLAIAASLGALLVQSCTGFPLHEATTAFLAWLLAGQAWSGLGPRVAFPPRIRRRIALGVLLLILPALVVGRAEWRAQSALGNALAAHERGDCPGALKAAGRTAASAPWRRHDVGLAAMIVHACEPDPQRSLATLEPALATQPHQLNLLLAAGARRLKAGRAPDAEAAFRHAAEIAPALANPWLGLAMARDAQGHTVEARSACQRALAAVPVFEPARQFCSGITP